MLKNLIKIVALLCIMQAYGRDIDVSEQSLFKKQSKHNHKEHDIKCCEKKCFKHNIKLQLSDSLGFPVPNTEFWVTVDVVKNGSQVTLELPTINFQTGPQEFYLAQILNYYYPGDVWGGGYIYTSEGFLPEDVRPSDLVYQSIVGASNNGLSLPWDFTELDNLPVPPVGYIVQVTNAGALVIQCAGTYGNIIPGGPQILMPCSITYTTKPRMKLCENFIIADGFTNTTQFPAGSSPADAGFRDSHVNAACDGKMAWSWTDNSMEVDKTNGVLNAMVATGKTDKHGKVRVGNPIQLTNFPDNVIAWDTAVTINPTDPKNIIVSYGLIDYTNSLGTGLDTSYPCRAVSFDGGKTWPAPYEYVSFIGEINGTTLTVTQVFSGTIKKGQTLVTVSAANASSGIIPYTTITGLVSGSGGIGTYTVNQSQTVNSVFMAASHPYNGPIPICAENFNGFGDNRGVSADKYGNIWYLSANFFQIVDEQPIAINQPLFAMSSDKGVTFTTLYVLPLNLDPNVSSYDYPQYCFGGDGQGNYGLQFVVDSIVPNILPSFYPVVGFIPIMGADLVGSGTQAALTSLLNVNVFAGITASSDGRVWYQGVPSVLYTYISPIGIVYKSRGALDVNYAGPWHTLIYNGRSIQWNISLQDSQPVRGYIAPQSIQSIIYDDKRQALYAVISAQFPDYSQNARLYFIISRDNGQTWSDPLDISTTDFANRGFQSMALDPVTGDLVFGWYDGRNDPTFQSVQYWGARITAKQLDKMVNAIPLSDPQYELPSAAVASTKSVAVDSTMQHQQDNMLNKYMQKRLERKRPYLAHSKDKIEKMNQAKA